MKKNKEIGITDANLEKLRVGDTVRLFKQTGEIIFESGAYGIGFLETIDWDYIDSQIPIVTGTDNNPRFCRNDNFVSFWELLWNFNCEEDYCSVVEKLKRRINMRTEPYKEPSHEE